MCFALVYLKICPACMELQIHIFLIWLNFAYLHRIHCMCHLSWTEICLGSWREMGKWSCSWAYSSFWHLSLTKYIWQIQSLCISFTLTLLPHSQHVTSGDSGHQVYIFPLTPTSSPQHGLCSPQFNSVMHCLLEDGVRSHQLGLSPIWAHFRCGS